MESLLSNAPPVDLSATRSMAFSDINALKGLDKDSKEGVRAVAEQFESLFLDMVLKSMREANKVLFKDSLFSSEESEMHQEMLDHQWAIHMSENGGVGLADMVERQMNGQQNLTMGINTDSGLPARKNFHLAQTQVSQALDPSSSDTDAAEVSLVHEIGAQVNQLGVELSGFRDSMFEDAQAFVKDLLPKIESAVNGSPFSSLALIAQGALETGWGRHVIQRPDGSSSHNLFGIKAGQNYKGETVSIHSMEFLSGVPVNKKDDFRAYPDWESSIRDYMKLISANDRYSGALENAADPEKYAEQLQAAGYATDPKYASKFKQVIHSVLNNIDSSQLINVGLR